MKNNAHVQCHIKVKSNQQTHADLYGNDCHTTAAAASQTHIELESQEIIDKDDMDPARMLRIACDQELAADRIR